jgi:5-methylcytosine-specific restriction protein B
VAALKTKLEEYSQTMENAISHVKSIDSALSSSLQDASVSKQLLAEIDLNQILYGPPGTGKTYATINHTLSIVDPEYHKANSDESAESRKRLKTRFDELVKENRVRFVTFHQSFSYEDFVEGLRADSEAESKQIEYRVESGVFKGLCDDARTQEAQIQSGIRANPRIWKISINGTGSSSTKDYCFEHGEARIGWGDTGDLHGTLEQNDYYQALSHVNKDTLSCFADEITVGDILLCIHSQEEIGAIGVVTGDYRYEEKTPDGIIGDYQHMRPVRWMYRNINLSILPLNDNLKFTQKTVYPIDRLSWADLLIHLEQHDVRSIQPTTTSADRKPYVLIIDEINRGNISRIFGELITLIEPSKREGANEALTVQLPYSKKPFSVPKNVYILGTMNTADRSLANLDIALRRRFTFREMPPQPELLDTVKVEGLVIGDLMRVMNQRIEVLLGKDYCLGHAYFIPLNIEPTLGRLATIFRNQIIPLLQEYFFEDWQRIQWVLNDHRKADKDQFVFQRSIDVQTLFGSDVNVESDRHTWHVNEDSFERLEAYLGVVDPQRAIVLAKVKREVGYGEWTLCELESGSIEVLCQGVSVQATTMPLLKTIAETLGVPLVNNQGNPLNTRALGNRLIDRIRVGEG